MDEFYGYWVSWVFLVVLGVAVLRELPLLLSRPWWRLMKLKWDVLLVDEFVGKGVPPQPGYVNSAWLWGGVGTHPPQQLPWVCR